MNKPAWQFVLTVSLTLLMSAAASQELDGLHTMMEKCAAIHGYDAQAKEQLGPYQLGVNERALLQCVYDDIRRTLIPTVLLPDAYEDFIQRHQKMTDEVEQGAVTRQQRRELARRLLDDINRRELAEREKRIKELSIQRDQFLQQRKKMLQRQPISNMQQQYSQ